MKAEEKDGAESVMISLGRDVSYIWKDSVMQSPICFSSENEFDGSFSNAVSSRFESVAYHHVKNFSHVINQLMT